MRDYGSRHPLFLTPSELRANSRVSDEFVAPLTNERPHESRPIADVNLHIFQRCGAIVNKQKIWSIKNAGPARAHAICDRGRKNRMFDRERLKCNTADFRGIALVDELAVVDLAALQRAPRFPRRVHRTRRAFLQAPSVIRMRVCKHDRAGAQPLKFSQPIKAAINHHIAPAVGNEQ
jgi:hypothetical protein